MPHRTNIAPAPAPVRLVARTLALGLGVPILRVLDRFGWHHRLMQAALTKAAANMELNPPFKGYEATAHDVFVCTYVKSGTNWMMQLVHQIAWRGKGEYEHIHDVVPWPDSLPAGLAIPLEDESVWRAAPTGLWAIKTHRDWDQIPHAPQARYITVVRDPKETVVSGYYFSKDSLLGSLIPSVGNWVELSLMPHFYGTSTWARHTASYWAERHRPNVLFLFYDEMKADFPRVARRVADFMGVTLAPDEMEAVIRHCDFSTMKANSHKFNMPVAPWVAGKGTMIRKGQVGKSSELLTPVQQQRIDSHWKAELQRLGSDFPYDEHFGGK